jgi:hypothetical protein
MVLLIPLGPSFHVLEQHLTKAMTPSCPSQYMIYIHSGRGLPGYDTV